MGRALLVFVTAALFVGASTAARAPALVSDSQEAHVRAVVSKAKAASPIKNAKPLIGILTQPCHDCPGRSYIAAGFVKWIESAGGRAVPVRFYDSDAELHRIFKSINGLIFPGGLTWLWLDAPYVITARKLFNWAVEANDKGEVFPIHGTCLGFQLLHILASNISRNDLLVDTDSVAHATTLQWTEHAEGSRLFGSLAADLKEKLPSSEHNLALENHMYGLPPDFYERWPVLGEWYKPLSTTKDRNGVEYVSSMEGRKYPFFGTQWHPEKPPFEFGMEEVPHSLDAIRVSQHLANVFIQTARESPHKPESPEEELALEIYDTPPVFSIRFETFGEDNYDGPDMTYYFDSKTEPPSGPDDAEDERSSRKHFVRAGGVSQSEEQRRYWATRATAAAARPARVGDDGVPPRHAAAQRRADVAA